MLEDARVEVLERSATALHVYLREQVVLSGDGRVRWQRAQHSVGRDGCTCIYRTRDGRMRKEKIGILKANTLHILEVISIGRIVVTRTGAANELFACCNSILQY